MRKTSRRRLRLHQSHSKAWVIIVFFLARGKTKGAPVRASQYLFFNFYFQSNRLTRQNGTRSPEIYCLRWQSLAALPTVSPS
jgi:hypothetical protein